MKAFVLLAIAVLLSACDVPETADRKQSAAQAKMAQEAHSRVGMPAITEFQEKRMMKDLYELRDKAIATHAYIMNEMAGCLVYMGPAVGYGLPYSTQYTAPEQDIYVTTASTVHHNVPQPEPNGLFMPPSAEGTWVMLKEPAGESVKPVYVEPRVIVSPFRLPANECPAPATPKTPR